MSKPAVTVAHMNAIGQGKFPGYLGMEITSIDNGEVAARMPVMPHHLAPNGFLHAGSVVTLADTCCGYACRLNLPDGAENSPPSNSNPITWAPRAMASSPASPSPPTWAAPPRYGMPSSPTPIPAKPSPSSAARK
jgi:hypothetical protein